MFAIPQMMGVPALTGVGVGIIEWPTLGVFLAWALIAALVGTGLGTLRRLGAQPPAVRKVYAVPPRSVAIPNQVHADHNHLEAA